MTDNDVVVLAAAGPPTPTPRGTSRSSPPSCGCTSNRIVAAYGASAKPSVPDAVAMLREEAAGGAGAGSPPGRWTWAAAWSLRPTSWRRASSTTSWPRPGADLVTEPLLPSPVLAEIALERYDAPLGAQSATPA